MMNALREHWPEYLIEAALLGLFMISASTFGVLMDYPGSPAYQSIGDPFVRRMIVGIAMGLTAIGLLFSPWGKQSGGHINPAVTLTFYRLGKIKGWDAIFYVLAQFIGGAAGVLIARLVFKELLDHPSVNYVATLPGMSGVGAAIAGEFVIAFVMMLVILHVTNTPRIARFAGLFAGALVALYITFEAPLSGMSMNPARTFGSAVFALRWDAIWLYFTVPVLAMLSAAGVFTRIMRRNALACVKLHHENGKRCIHCGANM